jgi:hypothetical protein
MTPTPTADRQRALFAEEALRAIIVSYLAEHPGAMDTIDGIAEWWITRQQIRTDVERLTMVLEQLVRSGVLEAVDDGERRMYRLRTALSWTGGMLALPELDTDSPNAEAAS